MKRVFGALCLILLFSPCFLALAAETGGHSFNWSDLAWRIVNFTCFVGVLYYLLNKKIRAFFSGRKEQIKKELTDLEERKNQAEKKLAAVEERIALLNQEGEAIIQNYREQAEAIRASILQRAEIAAKQITDQAKFVADNEVKQTIIQLRAEMADMVVDTATHLLLERLDSAEQEKLIDKYLKKVVLN